MRKGFLLCLLALLPGLKAAAFDFESDGIYYTITGSATVSVSNGDYAYAGDVIVPATVNNSGKTYSVTAIGENAFQSAADLESITLPEGLTTIGDNAFYQSGVKTVNLPSTLSSLGTSAFRECVNLKSIALPDALVDIKESAFDGCSTLKTLTLSVKVKTIEQRAFFGVSIETLTVPSTAKYIAPMAFGSCKSLKTLQIDNAKVLLDMGAFADCTNLEQVDLGNAVTNFGCGYFYVGDSRWPSYSGNGGPFIRCTNLAKIVIPPSITELKGTFAGCSRLYDVTLPATLTTIGDNTFSECAIKELDIPENVSSIGSGAFKNCPLTSIELPSVVTSIGNEAFYGCPLTNIVLPESLTTIGNSAFNSCPLTSIIFPSSLKTIGQAAFSRCPLRHVVIPQSVTLIGDDAFNSCESLKRVKIENAPVTISNSVFSGCTALEELDLGNSLEALFNYCFQNCTSLKIVTLPKSISTIPNSAFLGCTSLTAVNIPNTVQSIEGSAFNGCKAIKDVVVPESVTSMGSDVFRGCINLESAVFDNCVLAIPQSTFYDCTKLRTVDLGKATSIGTWAFRNCTSLEEIVIPNSVERLETPFYGCSALKKVVIGAGVKTLTDINYNGGCFENCTKLVDVEIKGNSLTTVGTGSFKNCRSLKKIELPSSVTSIQGSAFSGCSVLSNIYMNAATPPTIEANTFPDYETPTLHVPSSAKTAYTRADNWKNFTNVITIGSEPKATTEEIAALENLVAEAQTLYNNAVEGNEPGNYRPGAKATLMAVINEVNARISDTMLTEDVEDCTELLQTAIRSFQNKQVKNDYQTDNTLAIAGNVKAAVGTLFDLPVAMTNADAITAVQFDLYLPEEFALNKDENDNYDIRLSERATESHAIAFSQMGDGALRIVLSSAQNVAIEGNDGVLLTLQLFAKSTMEAGDYNIALRNIIMTDAQAKRYAAADMSSTISVSAYRMGDVNDDGHIDVADLTGVVHFILETADETLVFNAADMDENGVVEVNDYAALVNVILSQSTDSRSLSRRADAQADGLPTVITLSGLVLNADGEGELVVSLAAGSTGYTGFMFDLCLPEGVTLAADDIRTDSHWHGAWVKQQSDGTWRVLCSSMMNAVLTSGEVMRLPVKAAGLQYQQYNIAAENIVLSTLDAVRHEAAPTVAALNSNDINGIADVKAANGAQRVYDMQGRRVEPTQKGIYIVNGKKVVVR